MSGKQNTELSPESEVRRDFVPAADYSPEFHRLEMERLWPRVWQIACREEEIPDVGDYVNYEIGHESILVVRNAPGSIKAFYNVCPHRGRRLCDDARGRLKKFFCGYHAWTFDLDGKVSSIPEADGWEGCPQFSEEDVSLSRVRADTWAGFVWINMNPQCETLQEFLAPLPEKFDAYEWELCRMRSYQTIIFPVNWKVAIEAFVEAYHVVGTHPQLLRYGHGDASGLEEFYGPGQIHGAHTGGRHYEFNARSEFKDAREYLAVNTEYIYNNLHGLYHDEGLAASRRLLTEAPAGMTLSEARARLSELRREEYLKSGARYPEKLTPAHFVATEVQIFPNSSTLPTVEGAFWYRARPNGDDPDSTIFDIWCLGRFAPGKEPAVRQEFYENLEAFKGKNPILEQDFANMVAVHKGMRSRGWKGARPHPKLESNVSNIHRVLHDYVYGAGPMARVHEAKRS
jgi:phenylpropionate dioxygenase-like ring-hydroxylating dioxygenase large terminal subunit